MKWMSPCGEEKVLRLKEEMSVKWRELGQNVGVSEAKLAGFRSAHLDPEECMNAVIQAWIEKGSQKVILKYHNYDCHVCTHHSFIVAMGTAVL